MQLLTRANTWGRKTAAVLVVGVFLSPSVVAEVLQGELGLSEDRSFPWINLETGFTIVICFSRRCIPLPPEYDFRFSSSSDLPVLVHNTSTPAVIRRIAIFDEYPFDTIGVSDIKTAAFSTSISDFPLEPDDTVILQTDSGAYYRIGNFILSNVTNSVRFDYEDLTGELEDDRLFLDGFENPQ
jgi:hypothetical protein